MPDLLRKTAVTVLVAVCLSALIAAAGCDLASLTGEISKFNPSSADKQLLKDLPPEFLMLSQAWNILHKDYVEKDKIDPVKLAQGAVRGMVDAVGDPHTNYVSPEAHKMEMSGLTGQYQGIGAYIGKKDNRITVTAPMPGSPAEKAGIKAGDIILKIDGQPTDALSTTEAALKIQGPAGTVVKLTLARQGEPGLIEKEITRSEIKVPSVTSEMRGNIAYIRIQQFVQSTTGDVKAALQEAREKGARGLILDLRNNPGGILTQAVEISSQFLLRGMVVKVVDGEGNERPYMVQPGGAARDIPMVLLVNEGSASASEIVAAALQANGRAKLAGTKTYGKGSVQIIRKMDDGSAVHVTIAKFYAPDGKPINGVGLTPDYELTLKDEELVKWAEDYMNKLISELSEPAVAALY